jgi:broad specificity phosphatase PhoE
LIERLANKFPTQTIVIFSHKLPIFAMVAKIRKLDYHRDSHKYLVKSGKILVYYRDNEANTEVNLHKPYVDTYRGMRD